MRALKLLSCLALPAALSCGAQPTGDAADAGGSDASSGVDAAFILSDGSWGSAPPDASVPPDAALAPDADFAPDAGLSPDVGPDAGAAPDASIAATCTWIDFTQCDGTTTIRNFCPNQGVPRTLKRCDTSLYTPNDSYLDFKVEGCSCAPDGQHVIWKAVECCN